MKIIKNPYIPKGWLHFEEWKIMKEWSDKANKKAITKALFGIHKKNNMKKIELPWYEDMSLLKDIKRIQEIVFIYGGYVLDWEECVKVWEERSDTFHASWLMLPKEDEDVYDEIIKYGTILKDK